MATNKPTKPSNEFLSTGFGGVKNDFSGTLKSTGFDKDSPQILQGDNLNFTLDTIGLQLKYLTIIADYINGISSGKVPYINGNGQLDFADINTLLPSQSGKNGQILTTNGSVCSWSNNEFKEIGELYFTLDFNKTLPSNCVWLEGAVKPTTGEWAQLFAKYGWTYDTSYTNTTNFRLPDFRNKCIWGSTSAGVLTSKLPTIAATMDKQGDHTHDISSSGAHTHTTEKSGAHTHKQKTTDNDDFGDRFTSGSAASSYEYVETVSSGEHTHKIASSGKHTHKTDKTGSHDHTITVTSTASMGGNIIQPPAIKVRVYTRYK